MKNTFLLLLFCASFAQAQNVDSLFSRLRKIPLSKTTLRKYAFGDGAQTSLGMLAVTQTDSGRKYFPLPASTLYSLVEPTQCFPHDNTTELYPIFGLISKHDTCYVGNPVQEGQMCSVDANGFCTYVSDKFPIAKHFSDHPLEKSYWGPLPVLGSENSYPIFAEVDALTIFPCALYFINTTGVLYYPNENEKKVINSFIHADKYNYSLGNILIMPVEYDVKGITSNRIVGGRVSYKVGNQIMVVGIVRDWIDDISAPSVSKRYLVIERIK